MTYKIHISRKVKKAIASGELIELTYIPMVGDSILIEDIMYTVKHRVIDATSDMMTIVIE